MLPLAYAVIGEHVLVNKLTSPMHNTRGEIWKTQVVDNRLKISVSFNGEIYNFYREELLLA